MVEADHQAQFQQPLEFERLETMGISVMSVMPNTFRTAWDKAKQIVAAFPPRKTRILGNGGIRKNQQKI